ncbi:MAG: class I SAM-dependent methyltransferase [Elusimicrobia bacterium]|nr:class I SAM-dependent methyltransferase [Elusimicrobiota bacterium]
MLTLIAEAIEDYAATHSSPESPLLQELTRETQAKTKIPQMLVGHLEGTLLKVLVRLVQAKHILEIGTFTGYSALAMAEGLPGDGKLITCDIDPETAAIAKRYWSQSPHGSKIEMRLGPALETLQTLPGPFEMVFIDADKENYARYWELCVPKVRSGGILVADNVLWSGRVLHPTESSDHAIVAFNRQVHNDPRVEAVILTVRDGVLLALKR